MIYLLHGTDRDKARKKMTELVIALQTKKPDLSLVKVTDETWNRDDLPALIGSQGLFERKMLIQAEYLLAKKAESAEAILESLVDIAESENVFIFLEGEVDAATRKKLEAKAHKAQEFEKPDVPEPRPDFNVFALTDALGRRDKKSLWVLYQEAMRKNVQPEEIHGILFWQVKSMLLVIEGGPSVTPASTGLAPFVFKKAEQFSQNYNKQELEQLSLKLVTIFHDARASGAELGSALEQFILEV